MALPELNVPSWLNAGEPAGAPMLRGAQAGGIIANNFMQARAMKERKADREQQFELQSQALQIATAFKMQEKLKMELAVAELYKERDLSLRDTANSPELLSKVTRAVASGIPDDPIFHKEIGGWLEKNMELVGQPKTTAFLNMWEKAKAGQKEKELINLKHQNEILEITARNTLITDRITSVEEVRQQNREALARLNGSIRQEMIESRAKLHVGKVGVDAYVNRWLGTVMREAGVDSRTAMQTLQEDFYSENNPFGATKPGAVVPLAPVAEPAQPAPDPLGLF